MRYSITSARLNLEQIEAEAAKVGARNVRKAPLLEQLFCELDEGEARKLSSVPGLKVKAVREFKAEQVVMQAAPVVTPETVSDVFYLLRSYFTPPLTGSGLTVAVLDSGIRKTHETLAGKVIYEKNCTDSPGADDIFGHGTNVAFVIGGGMHAPGEKAGVSPGAAIMNVKVINDEGLGTDESIVLGIDDVCKHVRAAREKGLLLSDDAFPNVLNLSFGTEDDGDLENPVRVACRKASVDYGLDVIAAAGNSGPKMSTIKLPACEPEVIAVGGMHTLEFEIWEKSSRGPTMLGDTKPDFVFWSTDIEVASYKADDGYDTKTGTSFSCPMLSGLTGLLWESGRRSYGEGWPFRWTVVREFAPYVCLKPEQAPVKKDNTYGFGLPAMSAMLGEITGAQPLMAGMAESMGMVMMMAMMASVVGGAA